MKKWIFFLALYLMIAYFALRNRESLLAWIHNSDLSHLPVMFLLAVLFAVFPIIPFTIFAGIMGAKYGLFWGTGINWFGSVSAAMIFFVLARYTLNENLRAVIRRYKKLNQFTEMVEKNAFIAVLLARTLHVIPTPVVNIYSGISQMPMYTYFLATVIGQFPGMLLYAYFGEQLFTSLHRLFIGIGVYIAFLFGVLIIYFLWFKKTTKTSLR